MSGLSIEQGGDFKSILALCVFVAFSPRMSKQLETGDIAPNFTLSVIGGSYEEGAEVSLSDLTGSKVVLYFYPKDNTPGCTVQACGLRDVWSEISAKAKIFGVSFDTLKKHSNFIAKYDLPFPLISDSEKFLVDAYGVWKEKKMYGRTFMGTERTTFVIDEQGKITAIFRKVKPAEHVDLLLDVL